MKIVFLDRDGVINQFPGHGFYVTKIKDFHFLPGSLKAIRELTQAGYTIFVVSNQAAVGKGLLSIEKLNRIDAYMHQHVKRAGGKIQQSFYCVHRSDEGCPCRKPNVGLIKKALASIHKTMSFAKGKFLVGDMTIDTQMGHKAGCKTICVTSGGAQKKEISKWPIQPDFIVNDLQSAVEVIIHENSHHSRNRRRRA
jgi:D-glycero-D-manno-heptose 1,7-bisphosphate phosphatase